MSSYLVCLHHLLQSHTSYTFYLSNFRLKLSFNCFGYKRPVANIKYSLHLNYFDSKR